MKWGEELGEIFNHAMQLTSAWGRKGVDFGRFVFILPDGLRTRIIGTKESDPTMVAALE